MDRSPNERLAGSFDSGPLSIITVETLSEAFADFPLCILPGLSLDWLALAVRRVLELTILPERVAPNRPSNVEIRRELSRLATLVQSSCRELFERSGGADSQLFGHAFDQWEGDDAFAAVLDPGFAYKRLTAAIRELDWLGAFLNEAAEKTDAQDKNWRLKVAHDLRVCRAHYLIPIFETAFGYPVTANNWPSDPRHGTPTPFMDFFQRVMSLAFGEHRTVNLSQVAKTARREHLRHPITFGDWLVPGVR